MAPETPDNPSLDAQVSRCLAKLAAGDDSARTQLIEICDGRIRELAHRLLGKFAKVRRWDNTDDVAQNAALRLYRALGETVPESPRGLMGLMATQIQRELIDLARKHTGPMSYAANHETNVHDGTTGHGGGGFIVDKAADQADSDEELPLERWEAFHAAVESLPDEHREVFKLVWYLGADQKSAADTLGMSLTTVGRRWREARELIQEKLGED